MEELGITLQNEGVGHSKIVQTELLGFFLFYAEFIILRFTKYLAVMPNRGTKHLDKETAAINSCLSKNTTTLCCGLTLAWGLCGPGV